MTVEVCLPTLYGTLSYKDFSNHHLLVEYTMPAPTTTLPTAHTSVTEP